MAKIVKRKEVMDMETGEVFKVISFIPEIRDKNFVKVFNTLSEKVIRDLEEINGAVYLLFWIMKHIKLNDDKIYINPKFVAEELGKSERTIHRYLELLVKKGYLFKIPKTRCLYRINTNYLVKGYVERVRANDEEF